MTAMAKIGLVAPREVPPSAALYQSMVPPVSMVAEMLALPVPQIKPRLPVTLGAAGTALMVTGTAFLRSDTQPVATNLD